MFFDNTTIQVGDQARARQAALKFIESNAKPHRLMAIVNFNGAIEITQNFTDNVDRLKAAAQGLKMSAVSPNISPASTTPRLDRGAAQFARTDMILSLRALAKNLSTIPGRKTLILLTGGFPVGNNPEVISEVTATIDACNKANVAIYPIDIRGLVGGGPGVPQEDGMLIRPAKPVCARGIPVEAWRRIAGRRQPRRIDWRQNSGGSERTGRGLGAQSRRQRHRIGTWKIRRQLRTGNGRQERRRHEHSPAIPGQPLSRYNNTRDLIPKFPESASTNQQLMYMLADGTGGFVIVNTNDLLGGLERIGKEQDEHYMLGYTPAESEEGSCHVLRVKVDRGGTSIRSRTGYCNSKPKDVLLETSAEKTLENRAASTQTGTVAASMQAPYFYTAPNVARVNVAMEIPPETMKFTKEKGKQHAEINVLGIAYKPDGSVGARFSDTVKLDFADKKDVDIFKQHPYHYENQFDVATGKYDLKVVFSSGGESFGKVETPLVVDPYDGTGFSVSALAFSDVILKSAQAGATVEAALLEDRTPLMYDGLQIVPSGVNRFKSGEKVAMYFEIYEPLLVNPDPATPLAVALQVRVLDAKTGEQKSDTGLFRIPVPDKGASPMMPFGGAVPVTGLAPGAYRLELTAIDSADKKFQRTGDFVIQ